MGGGMEVVHSGIEHAARRMHFHCDSMHALNCCTAHGGMEGAP
jgi:hypothetical protein